MSCGGREVVLYGIPSVVPLLLKTVSITVTNKFTDSSQVKMNVHFKFFCLSHVGMKWEMFSMELRGRV